MKLFLEHHLLEGIRNHNYSPVTALQICDEMHQLKLLIDPVTFDKTVLSYITEHVQYLEGE